MPAVPGESLLTTLFADVHYYFSDPSAKPLHHRFSKASYVYLYHNPAESRAKLEIANHAGTPEQDAFHGFLSSASSVRYSYKQPTLFSVTLNTAAVQSQQEWHLPSYNERNEQKYLYKIHAVDIYLWTEKDAVTLLRHLHAALPAEKLDVRDVPPPQQALPEHGSSMSPVVQQLERTAIGAHFPPRAESTTSTHSFPGPPTPPSTTLTPSPRQQHQQQQQQQAPTPLAYNPAAPRAPEPIAYREKTPPPPENLNGTGLQHAGGYNPQYASVPQSYASSLQNTPQASYFPGPPQLQQHRQSSIPSLPGPPSTNSPAQTQRVPSSSSFPPPPPPPSGPSPLPQTPSFGPPPTAGQPISPPPTQPSFNRQSIYGAPTQQFASYPVQQHAQYLPSPGSIPAVQSPGFPAYGNAQPQPQPPALGIQQQQQQPPIYPQQQQQQPPTPSAPPAYGIHTPLQSPAFPPAQIQPVPQPQHQSTQQQAAQIAGYSSYTYTASAPQPGTQQQGYDVHAQLYRPTGSEAAHGAKPGSAGQVHGGGQGQGQEGTAGKYRVNERVDKVEKGVGRFLKKLDSKW